LLQSYSTMVHFKKLVGRILFLFFFNIVTASYLCNAQCDSSEQVYTRKTRPAYTIIGAGAGRLLFRDFETSPLFYKGFKGSLFLGRLRLDKKTEALFDFNSMAAATSNNFNNTFNRASYFSTELYYHRLYRICKLSTNQYNTKAGAAIVSTTNLRINEAFGNDAVKGENITNIMGVIKVSRDISRTSEKTMKLFFIKKKLKIKKRALSYQLNIGLINLNYRSVYPFLYSGDSKGIVRDLMNDYALSMNGYRLGSHINYVKYLPNGNGIQYSYYWDIYNAPGKQKAFQMASHTFQISLLFNTK